MALATTSNLPAQVISAPLTVPEIKTPLTAKRGQTLAVPLELQLRNGYHMNTNAPLDEYLIPLKLTWDPSPLTLQDIKYPPGKTEKYEFSDKPLAVYTSDVVVQSHFAVPASAPAGTLTLKGKLRYQACTDKVCLAPKTINVSVPLQVQ